MYALIDCNNFFVSCERVFNPTLWKKPTIVLSNNDGCAVARSQEVKDLGIPMGAPFFKIKDIIEKHNIQVFSSNFELYGDLSNRVMTLLEKFSTNIEIYSIDEAFLHLPDKMNFSKFGEDIIKTVKTEIGLPVSVGIAQTKTLAKVANEFAKIQKKFNSTTDFSGLTEKELDCVLAQIPVEDIWGIGRNRSELLRKNGIYTTLDFKNSNPIWVKKNLSVLGERTHLEIHGVSCFKLDSNPTPKKGIASTRSFGRYITKLSELEEAVADYTANALRKLRAQNSVADHVTTYIRTNRFIDNPVSAAYTVTLPQVTDYTPEFITYAKRALHMIFREGLQYQKAGIYITGIQQKTDKQFNMFYTEDPKKEDDQASIMKGIDALNLKYGKQLVKSGSQGFQHEWKVKSQMISKRYTTRWDELLEIKI